MKTKALPLVAALAFALSSSVASALTLFPGSGTTAGTQLEDDDVDYFIDNNNNGVIDTGDDLIAPFEINQIIDILAPFDPTSPVAMNTAADELVGISAVRIVDNLATDPTDRLRFGAIPDTPMVSFYNLGSTINLDVTNCGSLAECTGAANDGTLWASFSIADADDEWFFDPSFGGATDPAAVAALPAVTKVGTVNFALSQLIGGTAPTFDEQALGGCGLIFQCNGDGLVDLLGSADILGGLGLGFDPENPLAAGFARSDADFSLNVVPEPTALALLGIGLLGMGAARRRK